MPEELSSYATRPLAFFLRYVQLRSVAHAAIVVAVILAVGCSVATQYGVKLLVEALGRLMRGRTVIAIAHRLSTVRNFDRILVLHKGRIVQDGAPDALVRTDGIYRSLVESEMKRLSATRSRAA